MPATFPDPLVLVVNALPVDAADGGRGRRFSLKRQASRAIVHETLALRANLNFRIVFLVPLSIQLAVPILSEILPMHPPSLRDPFRLSRSSVGLILNVALGWASAMGLDASTILSFIKEPPRRGKAFKIFRAGGRGVDLILQIGAGVVTYMLFCHDLLLHAEFSLFYFLATTGAAATVFGPLGFKGFGSRMTEAYLTFADGTDGEVKVLLMKLLKPRLLMLVFNICVAVLLIFVVATQPPILAIRVVDFLELASNVTSTCSSGDSVEQACGDDFCGYSSLQEACKAVALSPLSFSLQANLWLLMVLSMPCSDAYYDMLTEPPLGKRYNNSGLMIFLAAFIYVLMPVYVLITTFTNLVLLISLAALPPSAVSTSYLVTGVDTCYGNCRILFACAAVFAMFLLVVIGSLESWWTVARDRVRAKGGLLEEIAVFEPYLNALPTSTEEEGSTKMLTDVQYFKFGGTREFMQGFDVELTRSMRQEFKTNEDGKWLGEFLYVVQHAAIGVPGEKDHPARAVADTNFKAIHPSLKAIGKRDLGNEYKVLDDFFNSEEAKAAKLTLAETAAARLYTGPSYRPINAALRTENVRPWATTIALLYSAVLKLSFLSKPARVYRGVKEDTMQLPETFLNAVEDEFAGGVELAFMSTTLDPKVALDYSGKGPGSIFIIDFGMASRGASLRFLSQFPHEAELLFPPKTMLECKRHAPRGNKRFVVVAPTISTARPDTRSISTPDDTPFMSERSPYSRPNLQMEMVPISHQAGTTTTTTTTAPDFVRASSSTGSIRTI